MQATWPRGSLAGWLVPCGPTRLFVGCHLICMWHLANTTGSYNLESTLKSFLGKLEKHSFISLFLIQQKQFDTTFLGVVIVYKKWALWTVTLVVFLLLNLLTWQFFRSFSCFGKNNYAVVVNETKRAILSKAFDELGAKISSRWKLSELSIARAFLLTKRASHEVDISRILWQWKKWGPA